MEPAVYQSIECFLRLCLQSRWNPQALDGACAQAAALDWEQVLAVALDAGVGPLLYKATRGKNLIPHAVETELRNSYYLNAGRSILLTSEFEAIQNRLSTCGVPFILLKGAALAETIYKNPALRPMVDIDLLVQHRDAQRAVNALAGDHYIPALLDTRAGDLYLFESEIQLEKNSHGGLLLEIHWSLIDSVYHQSVMSMDWFWQTAISVPVGKCTTLILGPEAQIIHLCAHLLLHHSGDGILWKNDLAEVILHYGDQIDWNLLLCHAEASHLVLPIKTLLPQIAVDWGVPMPAEVIERLQATPVTRSEEKAYHFISSAHTSVANHFWADLSNLPNWRSRARYAWSNLFPSYEYMRSRYKIKHPALTALYYPYRWLLGIRSAMISR